MKKSLPATCYLLLATIFLIAGCATTQEPAIDTSNLQWPPAPDKARVRYVKSIANEAFGEKSIWDMMLGESEKFLARPRGITVDRLGNIYVTDLGFRGVFIIDQVKKKIRDVGLFESSFTSDVAVDDNGRIYIADRGRNNVYVYDQNRNYILTIGKAGELKSPTGLAIDNERQRLYVSNLRGHDVKVYDLSGNFLLKIGCEKGSGADGCFFAPQGLTLDGAGNLYVTDSFNFRVQSFTPEGKFKFKFGEVGDARGDFAMPYGIAVDSEGNIYVSDLRFNNVQVLSKEGKYIFTIGEYGDKPGTFSSPYDIYIDEKDMIYVVEEANRRIQIFQYLSERYKKEHPEGESVKEAEQPAETTKQQPTGKTEPANKAEQPVKEPEQPAEGK